jgi:hypothetical protein
MKNQNLLLKAAQQALSDILGYDEATAYFLLLQKQENQLETEFSYSKRYRIMKSLFDSSAVAKFKQKDKDFFSYLVLPPTFLYFGEESVDKELVEFLESIYFENYAETLEQEFSQIILRDERPLLSFLLRYFMKESAKVVVGELDLRKILGSRMDRVTFGSNKDAYKRMGIIDRKISFEFVSIPAKNSLLGREYIGYLSSDVSEKGIVLH